MQPGLKRLLDYIAKYESGGDYDIVWAGLRGDMRPPRRLTDMSIGEILRWQEDIRARGAKSTAAGKYQIIYKTLRGVYSDAGLSITTKFTPDVQDELALELLRRRGLDKYLDGRWSAETFCNSLAYEWASLPIVSGDRRGYSQYAGDGLNKAHAKPDEFIAVVKALRGSQGGYLAPLGGAAAGLATGAIAAPEWLPHLVAITLFLTVGWWIYKRVKD